MRLSLKPWLALLGLIWVSPVRGATVPQPCPTGFHCSYTYTVHWPVGVPTVLVISWSTTAGGAVDHSRTVNTNTGQAGFEVNEGTWYVRFSFTAVDGSLAPTMITYVIRYPTLLVPLGPAAPGGFHVT